MVRDLISLVRIVPGLAKVRVDSSGNTHRHHLLKKQFASVGNLDLTDLGGTTHTHGRPAFISHLLQVGLGC